MHARHRLKDNRDFRRVFQKGKSVATGRLVMYWYGNREACARVGFSVSKKVGNAVQRNRLKRVLRACFAEYEEWLDETHVDLVFVCRQGSVDATFQQFQEDVLKLLRKSKFMV